MIHRLRTTALQDAISEAFEIERGVMGKCVKLIRILKGWTH